jgi:hypothetical protein
LRDSNDLFPAYASVVDKLAPNSGEMPTAISYPYVIRDGAVTPGQHASFSGKMHDPFLVTQDPNAADFKLPELSLPASVSYERLTARRELQKMVDAQTRLLDYSASARGMDAYYDKALEMLHSEKLRNAFDLSTEPEALREKYGRTNYGQSLILARRLVEAGTKFVTVYFSGNIGGQSTTGGGWDTHGFNNTRMYPIIEKYHLPITDQTLPTFLEDMDERGLLDSTLVVWMGEFGRTPKINENASRDHWPDCYTVLLAGGGVKRGFIYGASDKNGAYPAENPVRPDDLAATNVLCARDRSAHACRRRREPSRRDRGWQSGDGCLRVSKRFSLICCAAMVLSLQAGPNIAHFRAACADAREKDSSDFFGLRTGKHE